MSERMIELMRARMRLPTLSQPPPHHTHPNGGSSSASPPNPLHNHDKNLQTFLHLLSSSAYSQSFTVPTNLSRRILQTRGVDFLDNNVAAVASLAADRFLATVLHQAMACRDRRIQGEELLKRRKREEKAWRKRRRSEMEEREMKRKEREERKTEKNLAAIKAAEALQGEKSPVKAGAGGGGQKGKKRSKKASAKGGDGQEKNSGGVVDGIRMDNGGKDSVDAQNSISPPGGGNTPNADDDQNDDDDLSYNSLDDEQNDLNFLNHDSEGESTDDDDEEDEEDEEKRFVLKLRDLQRPLEAWGVTLTGKLGLGEPDVEPEKRLEEKEKGEDTGADVASQDGNVAADANAAPASASNAMSSTPAKEEKNKENATNAMKTPSNSADAPPPTSLEKVH